jgi:uncharacterized protein (DUF952 family)
VDALFHIVAREAWTAAVTAGVYRAPSLQSEGFIHCSFADQVAGVANDLYGDEADLCVVELDPALIFERIVVEDSYGSGVEFPHVYGPIPTSAAVAVHAVTRGPAGEHRFTGGGAGASASPDR